jgi:hypothetical protein
LIKDTWHHVTFTYDGSRKSGGLALYLDGREVGIERGGGHALQNSEAIATLTGTVRTAAPLWIGGVGGSRGLFKGSIADFRIFNRAITEEDALVVAAWPDIARGLTKDSAKLNDAEKNALKLYFLSRMDTAYVDLAAELQDVNAERRVMMNSVPLAPNVYDLDSPPDDLYHALTRSGRAGTSLVMEERTDSKPIAFILKRGMYDQPGEAVEPAVPSALPQMPESAPRNRLGLAEWLVAPSNPLTARVAVNRFWQEVFGTGISRTSEDFGSQGEPPSHPQLLDWLAVEFRESGWDTKKLFRLMLTSATYRQAATVTNEKLAKDPENRLLSRAPRFRMDAEMVRDYALAASGLLVPTIGGPSVNPYQPPGVWEAVSMNKSNTRTYVQDHGDALYRRSLYTFWKRSAPPASLDIFGAPTRETGVVRRERTNSPMQALVTMNDTQFVEAARNLAQRALLASSGRLDGQIDFMTARVLVRSLKDEERQVVRESYQEFLRYYRSNRGDAGKLLAVGESRADAKLPVAEFAALTMVAGQLLNLDEALNK